jgi:hypothetical protein
MERADWTWARIQPLMKSNDEGSLISGSMPLPTSQPRVSHRTAVPGGTKAPFRGSHGLIGPSVTVVTMDGKAGMSQNAPRRLGSYRVDTLLSMTRGLPNPLRPEACEHTYDLEVHYRCR